MVDWDTARALTQEACASVFDTKRYLAIGMKKPVRDVNGLVAPDDSRPEFSFFGSAIDTNSVLNQIGPAERATASSNGDRNVFRSCMTALTADWPWMPGQGDRFLSEDTGQMYSIAVSPDGDGTQRKLFWLNKV